LEAWSSGWLYDNQNQQHLRHWILTHLQTTLTYTLVIPHRTHMETKTYTIWVESQGALKELMNQRKTNRGIWKLVDKESKENRHKQWAYK